MTATAHALIGTVIAAKVQNPYLAVPLALASHFVADLIPHWDIATNKRKKSKGRMFNEALIDVLFGFFISYFLIFFLFPATNLLYAFWVIVVAQLPDWLFAPYYFFGIKQMKWAYTLGKATNTDLDLPWGIVGQAIIVLLLILSAVLL
ncbi:MAG: hypothetical protein HY429_03085 [Candidatus Levybacteria bacterium]|nr:hypothetical protein [Candidatus Levybacteria bacterium]